MYHAVDSAPTGYRKINLKYGPYSASRLIIAQCPARFQSKYIFKDKIISDSIASARGSVIHYVLERITNKKVLGLTPSMTEIDLWLNEAMGQWPAAYVEIKIIKDAVGAYLGNPSPYMNETTKCEVGLAVAVYEEESFLEDVVLKKAFVKMPFEIDGRINSEAFFGVKIDQMSIDELTKTITILDHKSTPTTHKNPDHTFQVGTYAWIVSKYYPGYNIRTVIHYANPMLNCYGVPEYWSAEDIQMIEEELFLRVGAIESFETYPAIPGTGCDYCHMVQLCPANNKIREQNARGDINLNVTCFDDVKRLANQLRAIDVLSTQISSHLKRAMETYAPGGVALDGGGNYNFRSSESIEWDETSRNISFAAYTARMKLEQGTCTEEEKPALKELSELERSGLMGWLEKKGIDGEAFKKLDSKKLNTLLKFNDGSLTEELKKYVVLEKSTRFGYFKN